MGKRIFFGPQFFFSFEKSFLMKQFLNETTPDCYRNASVLLSLYWGLINISILFKTHIAERIEKYACMRVKNTSVESQTF